jgi:hypothetical protein
MVLKGPSGTAANIPRVQHSKLEESKTTVSDDSDVGLVKLLTTTIKHQQGEATHCSPVPKERFAALMEHHPHAMCAKKMSLNCPHVLSIAQGRSQLLVTCTLLVGVP